MASTTHVNAFRQDVADAFNKLRETLADLEAKHTALLAKYDEDGAQAPESTPEPSEAHEPAPVVGKEAVARNQEQGSSDQNSNDRVVGDDLAGVKTDRDNGELNQSEAMVPGTEDPNVATDTTQDGEVAKEGNADAPVVEEKDVESDEHATHDTTSNTQQGTNKPV